MEIISENIDRFGFTMCDVSSDEIVIGQKGVFRTNCLDWQVPPSFCGGHLVNRISA